MNLKELNDRYTEYELRHVSGDPKFRREILTPILSEAENQLVGFYSRFYAIVTLKDCVFTEEGFEAVCVPEIEILLPDRPPSPRVTNGNPLEIKAPWNFITIGSYCLSAAYCCWSLYPNTKTAQVALQLASAGGYDAALDVLERV